MNRIVETLDRLGVTGSADGHPIECRCHVCTEEPFKTAWSVEMRTDRLGPWQREAIAILRNGDMSQGEIQRALPNYVNHVSCLLSSLICRGLVRRIPKSQVGYELYMLTREGIELAQTLNIERKGA